MSTDYEHDSVSLVPGAAVRPFARAAMLAALTGAVALVSIPNPFSPVPVTLQVLFVFLAGLYLGPVWGAASMGLYLAAGAVGLPVYAYGRAGIGILLGDTGGFLWSYPVAAFLVGAIVHGRAGLGLRAGDATDRDRSAGIFDRLDVRDPADAGLARLLLALGLGTLVVYAMGAGYVVWYLDLAPREAIALYVAPFVIGELVKVAAAIAIVRSGIVDQT